MLWCSAYILDVCGFIKTSYMKCDTYLLLPNMQEFLRQLSILVQRVVDQPAWT